MAGDDGHRAVALEDGGTGALSEVVVNEADLIAALVDAFKCEEVSGLEPNYEMERSSRERAYVKAEAAECDCWRQSAPICARCKLKQAYR